MLYIGPCLARVIGDDVQVSVEIVSEERVREDRQSLLIIKQLVLLFKAENTSTALDSFQVEVAVVDLITEGLEVGWVLLQNTRRGVHTAFSTG